MPASLARKISKIYLLLLVTLALTALSACGDDTNDKPHPQESGGICQDVTCEQPEDHCDQGYLIAYRGGGVCDPDGGTCDFSQVKDTIDCGQGKTCVDGACVDDDLCHATSCLQPDNTCDGDFAVTYSGDGICQPADGECDYSQVQTRTYCAHGCLSGFCQSEQHPQCFNVECPKPADTCDGDTAVTYSGDGSCVELDGSCDFSAVTTRTDCAEEGQVCDEGACVAAGPGD